MTFPVKRVSSAKLTTLKLNTDQNLMSSICESNIVINKSQLVSMLLRPCSLLGSTAIVSTKTALGWFGCSITHFSNHFDETCLWLGHWFQNSSTFVDCQHGERHNHCFGFSATAGVKHDVSVWLIIIRWIRIFSSTSSWNGEDCIRDIWIHFQAIFGNEIPDLSVDELKNNQDEKIVQIIFLSLQWNLILRKRVP